MTARLGRGVNVAAKIAESSIASAAAIHLACAAPAVEWGGGAPHFYLGGDGARTPFASGEGGVSLTHFYLAGDVARTPLAIGEGAVALPTGPGLGIEVDEAAVERFRIR